MTPISVCIIAKNEHNHLEHCLQALRPYSFEIIVVDTGSTDDTVQIARKYTEQVYSYAWTNDFAAARNYAVSKAGNDWILSLDCDEYLEKLDMISLQKQLAAHPTALGMINLRNPSYTEDAQVIRMEPIARLFSRKHYHFEGAIHEQLVATNDIANGFFTTSLVFYHEGYATKELAMEKGKRNLTLLLKELAANGQDPYIYFQIGQCYSVLGETEQACHYYDLGLSMDVDPKLDYVQSMVEAYGYCLLKLKQYEQALSFEGIYEEFSSTADFVFLMGLIYMNNALFDKAINEFRKATSLTVYSAEGVNSYRANYNIGVINECMGNLEEAKKYYRMCGKYEVAQKRLALMG